MDRRLPTTGETTSTSRLPRLLRPWQGGKRDSSVACGPGERNKRELSGAPRKHRGGRRRRSCRQRGLHQQDRRYR
eukprot:2797979-Alexandrium_andersonii.AAC.1